MSAEFSSTALSLEDLIKSIEEGRSLGCHLAKGIDSVVYQSICGKWAIKAYEAYKIDGETVSLAKLKEYRDVTNKASALMEKENWRIDTNGLVIPIRAVPIDAVFHSSAWNKVVGISEFVDGPDISPYTLRQKGIKEQQIYDIVLLKMMEYSLILNFQLGVTGINIGTINTKLLRRDNNWTMIITDLCPRVTRLKQVDN